jgi:hypothetical protein
MKKNLFFLHSGVLLGFEGFRNKVDLFRNDERFADLEDRATQSIGFLNRGNAGFMAKS